MSNFILITSKEKSSGTNQNFKIKFSNPIENIKGVKISKISIPNSWYSVMTGINDKIYFTETTNWVATLTQGVYTFADLATMISTAMNTAYTTDNNFSCTFSSLTYKYTVSHSATNFSLTFGTNTTASARGLMGYSATDTGAATSHIANNLANLNYSDNILIKSRNLSGRNAYINGVKKNIIFPLKCNGNFGDWLMYESQGDDYEIHYSPPRQFDTLDFTLLFEDATTEIPLNGLDWSITLKFIKGNAD